MLKIIILVLLVIHPGFAAATPSEIILAPEITARPPFLRSTVALVVEKKSHKILLAKNPKIIQPIASITKLMTAMVIMDSGKSLVEKIAIKPEDRDRVRNSYSRLWLGTSLSRYRLLQLALMASENRAASALARTTFPGGKSAFISAMNKKAAKIGMKNTHFVDATGLSQYNRSTATDLVKLIMAASKYTLIKEMTTTISSSFQYDNKSRLYTYHNTNPLLKRGDWMIGVSKTGFIKEAGRCLVLEAQIKKKSMIIILLNSWGTYSSMGDANRIKNWIINSIKEVISAPN